MAEELHRVKIRASLIRQLGWLGGERLPVLLSILVAAYFGFIYTMAVGIFEAVVVAAVIWSGAMFVLTRMGKSDMQMTKVWWRHRRYKAFYPAKGRLDSPVREMTRFDELD